MRTQILMATGIMILVPSIAMASVQVPEPGSMSLVILGLASLAALARKFRK